MFFNSFFRYFLYLTGTKFILAPVDESGIIEYLEDNEVLEDIYTSLQRMEEIIMDMRMVLESSSEESDDQIDDIDF